ncbi:hypothetical protein CIHG_00693 [Coccidioides immitis H538.4]|uniref:Uncharacterized protein n=3 Tax=Coccidioides immitis TaxID=5501 RepID=A0A0J8QNN5_COCIT|nr:hypothetical protein CIRG_03113 [Coccidioides immitis RMSCC 2394]KMU73960.1 hypothetical protein CISG_03938 [Coccidioides immitis RMSCC 3703]KMU82911.1 hypothetical protein CIHG_00693 [Coccidioides immitis H538.4]
MLAGGRRDPVIASQPANGRCHQIKPRHRAATGSYEASPKLPRPIDPLPMCSRVPKQ